MYVYKQYFHHGCINIQYSYHGNKMTNNVQSETVIRQLSPYIGCKSDPVFKICNRKHFFRLCDFEFMAFGFFSVSVLYELSSEALFAVGIIFSLLASSKVFFAQRAFAAERKICSPSFFFKPSTFTQQTQLIFYYVWNLLKDGTALSQLSHFKQKTQL